jgi:glycosyltransferase involved in cell wall biosynthesis
MGKLIKGRDIVVIGQQPWDISIGSNCKNIALEFAKNNRVLYVNIPLNRMTLLRKKKEDEAFIEKRMKVIQGKSHRLDVIEHNLWNLTPAIIAESINGLPLHGLFKFLNKKNNKKLAREINWAIDELNFKDFILFNDSEMFGGFYLKEFLRPDLYIYYSRDNLISTDFFKRHGSKLEPQLIAKADLTTANSTYLRDYCKQYNPNSYYVGQGCDLTLFDANITYERPPEIKGIEGPIIGYIGVLFSMRLDIDILIHIAKSRPNWSVVLVGPEDEDFKNSALHQLPNVIFTGGKKTDELAAYLNYFDVALNPQVVNHMTIGNYPRKIDEYLAMGKPTVATKTLAMEVFSAHVYLGQNKEDYIELIEKALAENNEQLSNERKAFAQEHTWENSVALIYDAINDTVGS